MRAHFSLPGQPRSSCALSSSSAATDAMQRTSQNLTARLAQRCVFVFMAAVWCPTLSDARACLSDTV